MASTNTAQAVPRPATNDSRKGVIPWAIGIALVLAGLFYWVSRTQDNRPAETKPAVQTPDTRAATAPADALPSNAPAAPSVPAK